MEQESTAISPPFDNLRELERLSDEEFWRFACEQASSAGEHIHREEYVECVLNERDHRCWLALEALRQVLPSPQRFALLPAMPSWMSGLFAWRGETLAVVDFAAYLTDDQPAVTTGQLSKGMLVIINDARGTSHFSPSLALFVADIGLTTAIAPEQIQAASSNWLAPERMALIRGSYDNAPVLDVSALLADIVKRIGIAAFDG
ncbi:MAG TPA: chemotaxis protein CheW [Ktedonobacteraceae bacterium]|nr:chemotaxis protein CheW [Ktedonobacteraceae bacterium]